MWHFGVSSEAAELADSWPDYISDAGFISKRIRKSQGMAPSSEEESKWLENLVFFSCNTPIGSTPTATREALRSVTGIEAECVLQAGRITIFDNGISKQPLFDMPL